MGNTFVFSGYKLCVALPPFTSHLSLLTVQGPLTARTPPLTMAPVFVPPKMKTASIEAKPPVQTRAGVYRWTICALLFFATTINYIDRQTISVLAPDLQRSLHWNELDYGNIIAAFQIMYAVGQVLTGFVVDRIGTFAGFAIFVTIWSIAAVGHASARSAFQFGVMRALLGLGESGNFPTCIKTVAEWFPRQMRALATGLFNSGSNR